MKEELSYCSPANVQIYQKTGTCFTKPALQAMARAFNKDNPGKRPIVIHQKKGDLWKALQKAFQKECGSDGEVCWVEQKPFRSDYGLQEIINKSMRAKKPEDWYSNPRTWLSNFDIEAVMEQYQDVHRDFVFVGVFPIDFASKDATFSRCVSEEICKLSIKDYVKQKKKHLGIVFNLDRHDEPGSHWVTLYANFDPSDCNYGVYYYDSNALPPGREIHDLMKKLSEQIKAITHLPVKMSYNKKRHQFKNTECGMFCLNFQLYCLQKKPIKDLFKAKLCDEDVFHMRDKLFRPCIQQLRSQRNNKLIK
jgi:hypothetical protein